MWVQLNIMTEWRRVLASVATTLPFLLFWKFKNSHFPSSPLSKQWTNLMWVQMYIMTEWGRVLALVATILPFFPFLNSFFHFATENTQWNDKKTVRSSVEFIRRVVSTPCIDFFKYCIQKCCANLKPFDIYQETVYHLFLVLNQISDPELHTSKICCKLLGQCHPICGMTYKAWKTVALIVSRIKIAFAE